MKSRLFQILISMMLAFAVSGTAFAISLEEAARRAAQQYNAKVLSARTINRNGERIHEIKLLTEKGVIKTVRIPENS